MSETRDAVTGAAVTGAAVTGGAVTGEAVTGRYQIVAVGRNEAVLLDTATGSSWSLARDVDTLQLGWQPLEERWPEGAFHPASDRSQALSGKSPEGKDMGEKSAAWWRPRLKSGWARSRQSRA